MSAKLLEALGAPSYSLESAKERRISERKVVSLRATVQLPDGTVLDGQTVDLSKTGVGLFSPRQLQSDQDCRLTIELSVCGETLELKLLGRVCYCTEQTKSRYRTGMRFVGMESGAAKLLGQLLS